MERIIGYARVSTADQATSVDAQSARLREFAAQHGTELAELFVDEDVSGGLPLKHRPAGRRLWDMLQRGDRVVFAKVDRCFRSMVDAAVTLAFWKEMQVGVSIIDLGIDVNTPAGELFFNQLASFAAFERAMIGCRIREAMAQRRAAGKPFGRSRPFGWVRSGPGKDAVWSPCKEERLLGERVVEMRDAGLTLAKISQVLSREAVTKPGKRRDAREGRHRGCYYLPPDIERLYRATKAGFPKLPRDAIALPAGT
jgi:putative DNA-invertase from lambdoid prophage Rac